jgi:NAD(P)-dependent dehydrogenase (short-subunit alcohol dehydrogenase family)
MSRLSGRRAVVTGGAGSIGAAIVRLFAAEGARVAVLDRRGEAASHVASRVRGHAYAVDLADVQGTREAMERAISRLDGIDVLVNNAGIPRSASLLEMQAAEWDEVFAVNSRSLLVTTQVAARAMIEFRTPAEDCAGKVINMAGTAVVSGGAGQAHYAASRAAVIEFTRAAAQELEPHGITVNCLCPGYVLTEMDAAARTEGNVAAWSALSPLGRLTEPEDVARAALFLASADADYLTGDALQVTGGMLVR